jgi:small subunit ribosomal protein S8
LSFVEYVFEKWRTREKFLELGNQVGKINDKNMNTDPIADMLNRIRTAQAVFKETVDIPFSDLKYEIAECLERGGFVGKVVKKKKEKRKFFCLVLKYGEDGLPAISELKRISSPGQRIYIKSKEIRKVKGGRGIAIISTPKGVMTNKKAREMTLGGEVICEIW